MTLESGTVTVALAAGYLSMSFRKADPAGLTSIVRMSAHTNVPHSDATATFHRSPAPPEHTT